MEEQFHSVYERDRPEASTVSHGEAWQLAVWCILISALTAIAIWAVKSFSANAQQTMMMPIVIALEQDMTPPIRRSESEVEVPPAASNDTMGRVRANRAQTVLLTPGGWLIVVNFRTSSEREREEDILRAEPFIRGWLKQGFEMRDASEQLGLPSHVACYIGRQSEHGKYLLQCHSSAWDKTPPRSCQEEHYASFEAAAAKLDECFNSTIPRQRPKLV